jgi:NDP-sugar pyrophosphorylase family protein
MMSPRVLGLIPAGETSLVADLWVPLLAGRREEIGWVAHSGPFADLGRPSDFLGASLEALDRGGPFPEAGGQFDTARRVLSHEAPVGFGASRSVLGRMTAGSGASITDSVIWDGAAIGSGARIRGCLVAGGRIPTGSVFDNALLWPGEDGLARPQPLV